MFVVVERECYRPREADSWEAHGSNNHGHREELRIEATFTHASRHQGLAAARRATLRLRATPSVEAANDLLDGATHVTYKTSVSEPLEDDDGRPAHRGHGIADLLGEIAAQARG